MRKILFLGQKHLGEAAWSRLIQSQGNGYQIAAACSNKSDKNVWWRSNRIFETHQTIPFIDNSAKNEDLLLEVIQRYQIDTILSVQHAWILSSKILAAVNYNALNFHNAKLPDYRGYNANNHALLNGDKQFTCTVHWMADEVDRGKIAFEATFDISPTETALSLYAKCYHAGLRLFEEILSRLGDLNTIPRRSIRGMGRFYSRKSIENLREIKSLSSDEAEIKARAFFFPPFEPAYTNHNRLKLYILPTDILRTGFTENRQEIYTLPQPMNIKIS
jgi:methionyl-tRNA formyltransferase